MVDIIQTMIAQWKSNRYKILGLSALVALIVTLLTYFSDGVYITDSKIFPLSFNKASESPLDAIKSQFGIADKTDYSVIYNINELVKSKTLSAEIAAKPCRHKTHKNFAQWLIADRNAHIPFYKKNIKIEPYDSAREVYAGADLLRTATEIKKEETEFTSIVVQSFDKDLSIQLHETILSALSEYYIQVSTEKPRSDLAKIGQLKDSLKNAMDQLERAIAGYQDANNYAVRYATGIPQSQLQRTREEVVQLYTNTAATYHNARFKLLSESPIFQILDAPGEPVTYKTPSWFKFGSISFVAFLIVSSFWVWRNILFRLLINELKRD
ncbi:MAG: hypothetical protein ACR2IL_03185 [Chitinophagaceae bacterium]